MAAPGANGGAGTAGVTTVTSPAKNVGVSRAYRTPPVRDMKSAPFTEGPQPGNVENEGPWFLRVPLAGLPEGDGALQTRTNGTRTPAPDQNFEGMPNACGCYPPDTNGAAGQNDYVQVVNAQFAAWTKTGTQVVPPTDDQHALPWYAALRCR